MILSSFSRAYQDEWDKRVDIPKQAHEQREILHHFHIGVNNPLVVLQQVKLSLSKLLRESILTILRDNHNQCFGYGSGRIQVFWKVVIRIQTEHLDPGPDPR